MKAKVGGVAVLALFWLGGLGLIGGAVWSYLDDHTGPEVQAKILDCFASGSGKGSNTYCTGRWTVDDRTVTGDVYNGRLSDEGKTITVRAHGGRATKPELWVSIALAVFGTLILGFGIWLTRRVFQARSAASGPSPA